MNGCTLAVDMQAVKQACIKSVCILIVLQVVYFLALWGVAQIPAKYVIHNIQVAVAEGKYQKEYRNVYEEVNVDNFTECFMLSVSAGLGKSFRDVIAMNNAGQCEPMTAAAIEGKFGGGQYARYWHGAQLILRPVVASVGLLHLDTLVCAASTLFLLLFLAVVFRRHGLVVSLMFLLGFLCVLPAASSSFVLLSYAPQFWLVLLPCLYLCRSRPLSDKSLMIFGAILGSLEAYFPRLNMSSLALSISLMLIVLRPELRSRAFINQFALLVVISLFWSVGYLGTWFVKWMLAYIFILKDFSSLFGDTLRHYPIGTVPILFAIGKNFSRTIFVYLPKWFFLVGTCVFMLLARIDIFPKVQFRNMNFALLIPGCVPILWLEVFPGHSYTHSWYVSFILWTFFASVLLFLFTSVSCQTKVIPSK